ncbi:TolB family protein [Echinicola rosea]|uniref:Uncharacterized protein n=1 Tax=Echinicola rosea TaxID=1807691 RepID=A0ABQ1VAP1_9BACT|nr:hypothetical protein [Echinicola rosea]GGF45883.1 hypothetical protein GCM10011339_37970 [Echinicola rosea]
MKTIKYTTCLTIFLLISFFAKAQSSSDLIVLETKKLFGNYSIIPGSAQKLTDREGYDNQPSFINNDQVAFSSIDEDGNSDIIVYSFDTEEFMNMTRTATKSEFSPRLTDCGKYISAVTVEEDSAQRLWLYPINFGEPELLYDDIEPVAYYAWYNNIAAMSLLGDPNKLVYPYSRENVAELAENIGNCIQKRPKTSEITYIDKGTSVVLNGKETFELKSYDLEEKISGNHGVALGQSDDFAWVDKNTLIMAKGQELYIKKINKSMEWEKIAVVSMPDYGAISRLAASPRGDKLVLVMERK